MGGGRSTDITYHTNRGIIGGQSLTQGRSTSRPLGNVENPLYSLIKRGQQDHIPGRGVRRTTLEIRRRSRRGSIGAYRQRGARRRSWIAVLRIIEHNNPLSFGREGDFWRQRLGFFGRGKDFKFRVPLFYFHPISNDSTASDLLVVPVETINDLNFLEAFSREGGGCGLTPTRKNKQLVIKAAKSNRRFVNRVQNTRAS